MGFVTDIVGDITGANDAADAAGQAGNLQYKASMAGVDEQRRQFDALVKLMSPFVTAGQGAMTEQQNLIGLKGSAAQSSAISNLQQSPMFRSLVQQGETSLLQNASATGGLRGGNTQAALAQFRPNMLNALIDQQYGRLGGFTTLGQASAAGQASAGMETGANVANLLQNAGQAQASGVIGQGGAGRAAFGDLLKIGGSVAGFF